MHTFPSSADVQGATYYYYHWSLDTISRLHLQCTISTPKGATPCRAAYRGLLQANTYTTYPGCSHPTGYPFIDTWVESSNVDKQCLAEGQKCQALTGIEPATLRSRVKGSIQYTTAPPQGFHEYFFIPTEMMHRYSHGSVFWLCRG